ncbi:MAG TPA: hypothetical protein DCM07_19545 [Planctomycetaceae bacterium]|nr:hypothetical protein [Planctomycetaceae bacterium]
METNCADHTQIAIRRHMLLLLKMWMPALMVCSLISTAVQAQPPQAEIDAAIRRGVSFLKSRPDYGRNGLNAFVAYTLLKAGEPPDSPFIQRCVKNFLVDHNQKNAEGEIVYKPGGDFNYCAGVQLMVLEAVDPKKYYTEIRSTVDFLIRTQHSTGSWYYPGDTPHNGDTSITQYAVLGLWAAERAGAQIPTDVWDKAARWHLSTQLRDGGFGYHPAELSESAAKHTMGVAGTGSLYIISEMLYPNGKPLVPESNQADGIKKKRFGFLEKVDLAESPDGAGKPLITKPTVPLSAIDNGKSKGLDWVVKNYNIRKPTGWPIYYLYGLERIAALADMKKLGPHDWYADGARELLTTQLEDGSWVGAGNIPPSTCLAIIFLSKATVKSIKPKYVPEPVGSGLLAGGRGLPENLAEVQMRNGKVQSKSLSGDLTELLAQLEDPANANLEATQESLIETITLGDREKLIQQKERVLKLIEARSPDVRRTAIWALARTNDFRVAPHLIEALNDPDLGVRIEARNGLCTLSRKIRGLGMPEDPLADVPDNLDEKERIKIVNQWSAEATKRWQKWYNSIKPFEEKFNLYEVLNQLPSSK